jgi:multidrug efflux pump subunit AcrA (membrane-fusion protein)
LICVVVTGLVMAYLEKTKPIAEKRDAEVVTPFVEVVTVQRKDVQFSLESEGVVSTLRETDLAIEVTGRVVFVDERFEAGGSFKADEIILTVDDTNYRAAKAQAQAALADARLNQEQEIARGAQAARDWEKIGGGEVAE